MIEKTAAIILAAGKGTRMKSSMPKVMHRIANEPMITHVMRACDFIPTENIHVVLADGMDQVSDLIAPAKTVIQTAQNGTADAAKSARKDLENFDGYVFILLGDVPLIEKETLVSLYEKAKETGLSVLGFETNTPHGFGRLLTNSHDIVTHIVEEKDASAEQKNITLCNSGAFCINGQKLFQWLDQIDNNNAQNEYYMPDIIEVAAKDGVECGYIATREEEALGVNSREQLAAVEKIMQTSLRAKVMQNGVTLIDPDTVFLSADTQIENDVIIEPNVFIGTGVKIGQGTRIHAFTHLEGCHIGENAQIGPFARIRPKSKIGNKAIAGNFIEVNRSEIKDGAKSKHVSYLGDAVIGEKTNVGAGTIIANYDGFLKHKTIIEPAVFIGSNSTLIAPLTVDTGAIIAAGSVITKNVQADDLAITRSPQKNMAGWAKEYRKIKKEEKKR